MAGGATDRDFFDWKDMGRPENCSSWVSLESSTSPSPEYDSVAGAETELDSPSTSDFVPLPVMESTETGSPPLSTEKPFGPVPDDVTVSEKATDTESGCTARAESCRGGTSMTVMATVSVSVPPLPSETATVMSCEPTWSVDGVQEKKPPRVIEAPAGIVSCRENDSGSPPGSAAVAVNVIGSSSSPDWGGMAFRTGGRLVPPSVTVTPTPSESVAPLPSDTRIVMVCMSTSGLQSASRRTGPWPNLSRRLTGSPRPARTAGRRPCRL